MDDTLADFSNYGDGVDIAAPGVCILSTYPDDRYVWMSGTSMAAPHVSGAAALLASMADTSPADIKDALMDAGNYEWTDDAYELELDSVKEPLLDLSDEGVFAPSLIPSVSPIQLEAWGDTVSGYQQTDLSWTGTASGLETEIYRDGEKVGSVTDKMVYLDKVDEKGAGMHFYWVCQTTCSNVVVVTY